jgi:hypothetical protein
MVIFWSLLLISTSKIVIIFTTYGFHWSVKWSRRFFGTLLSRVDDLYQYWKHAFALPWNQLIGFFFFWSLNDSYLTIQTIKIWKIKKKRSICLLQYLTFVKPASCRISAAFFALSPALQKVTIVRW